MTIALREQVAPSARIVSAPTLTDIIPLTLSSGGVTVSFNRETGENWVDVEIDHCPFALAALLESALYHGFVLDDPYYDEQQADGRLRSYLMEVEPV